MEKTMANYGGTIKIEIETVKNMFFLNKANKIYS